MSGVFNHTTSLTETKQPRFIYYGVVVNTKDDYGAKRIKVRIEGLDDGYMDSELPFSFPLLPKNISITPKKNELVTIFIPDINQINPDRFYMGSITPQPNKLYESDVLTARAGLNNTRVSLNVNPNKVIEVKGVFPDTEDLVFMGRENTEIRFDSNEIIIGVGKHTDIKVKGYPTLNQENQTYIQLKHNIRLFDSNETFSAVNIVSDKINLITHDGNPIIELNGGEKKISDEDMLRLLEETHPLPYGDKLVEYLMLMRNVLINHVHPYNGLKATNLNSENSIKQLMEFDVKTLLSKNIKIN